LRPIAIIGASCRFPGANSLQEFWELLRAGRNAVTTVPQDRWDADALVDQNPESRANVATRHGAFVRNIREFDCGFFGISPREAAAMDPQQRLLLETAYEAFEDAGIPMDVLAGSLTAVYVGIGPGDYQRMHARPWDKVTAHYVTGNFLSTAVDRLSYFFDLRGPSMSVDTACSSSLVSVHLACRSLETGEADIALAGGVNALLAPTLSISLAKAGALSPTGQCRSFDADADGYVRGEGAGFVVLKDLDKAAADGDRIYAVIRGTAVRQGGRRNGITAPGGWGEEAVIKAAWDASGISPSRADYVEAQATGTPLGDAIEANAISKALGSRNGRGPCRIGSVKTNIGHLETAAGIASLIKVALMMHHGELVPSLYPEKPNPHANLPKLGLCAQKQHESWLSPDGFARAAGVSAFGMGGTYAHMCLTSAEDEAAEPDDRSMPGFLLPLSARHEAALRELVAATASLIEDLDGKSVVDLCRAAAIRRTHHEYRVAFAALSGAELVRSMRSWVELGGPAVKVGKRKLTVVLPEADDFSDQYSLLRRESGAGDAPLDQKNPGTSQVLLKRLQDWGIRPSESLRYARGRMVKLSGTDAAAEETVVELEELKNSRADFLDLTREVVLRKVERPAGSGKLLTGFRSDEPVLLTPLRLAAELYALGYPISWRQMYPGAVGQQTLPSYPWQHQECWIDSLNSQIAPVTPQEAPHKQQPSAIEPGSNGNLKSVLERLSGLPAEQIRPDSSPAELGIDSLLTLELQEELRRMCGILVPVETLVQVRSVGELESLLQAPVVGSSRVAGDSGAATLVAPKQAVEIEEASFEDYESIAALVLRNGLGIKVREEWEHFWRENPVRKKHPQWPIGWVVRDKREIVGYLGNIPLSYRFKGREILASALHGFTMESSHRGLGLLLLNRLMEFAPDVEYFVGSSANANSSPVLDRIGISRVPVGDWQNSSFWITNYDGFVSSTFSKKKLPSFLAGAGAAVLKVYDKAAKLAWPVQKHELSRQSTLDERFDIFWEELQRAFPNRFIANRSREHLQWHFKFSLAQNRTWVVAHEIDSRVVAYGVFQRQDYREINLQRVRLVDYQSLPGFEGILPSILAWGLNEARAQGIHMLEVFGFRPEKQEVIDKIAPHRRKLNAWGYFHKIAPPALERELRDPNAWDPSQYDGDVSL
jgi:3-oxoacyl-(acyl-carrier-protein) synthase/acyl carrier protein